MATIRTQWQRIRNYIWLVCGMVCLFAALVFWAITDSDALVEVEKSAETESELQIQPEKVAASNLLGALQDEVRPLAMTTRIVTTASYESEFRGSKFINDNKNAITIELFRVTEDDVLRSFLKKQSDRSNFFYIRLNGESQIEQYVLLYGLYKNNAEAKQALEQLPLKFPKSTQPKVQDIENYVTLVNDMGAEEMATNNKLYAINLKSAPLPKVDQTLLALPKLKPAVAPVDPKTATTTTKVTRRDEQGNVVDIQESHSTVDPVSKQSGSKAAEKEISDPFN
ncbi:hypothetical protein [Acinetobacter kyonggiensis]|uniref:SPOR domain-containing protein n=1 Tax=Acinetobacter kyonggiensis TaxID=595670 RepID=A0A1H3J6W9_9GAMM|nr:hypothetical protein [Acinetobacter kyonggiensis]SDY35335.1 hypothetical protein SAMN05421643_10858 [Acinetobacter kyonggiensis]